MNELLIKNIIKYKLAAAGKILEQLPPELSGNLKNLSKIVLETIRENLLETKAPSVNNTKSTTKLNNIKIE